MGKVTFPRRDASGAVILTALQWETLRWAKTLNGLSRISVIGWSRRGPFLEHGPVERFMVPDALEATGWRCADEQVKALRRYGFLCWHQFKIVLTVHGAAILEHRDTQNGNEQRTSENADSQLKSDHPSQGTCAPRYHGAPPTTCNFYSATAPTVLSGHRRKA